MRTALITGGNRGIGHAIAQELASRGLSVIVASRSHGDGAAAARALGPRAQSLVIDMGDPDSIAGALAELKARGLHVDVLVNNAGICPKTDLVDGEVEHIRRTLEVNALGPLWLARGLLPSMKAKGYGRIVNVSSGIGALNEGIGGPGAYAVSKTLLNGLTARLAEEVQGNIKVNACCPGWVRTRMGGPGANRSVEDGADTAVWLATLGPDGPSGGFFRDRKPIDW